MADLNNFERVIKEDRAARESKQWRGTLLEYLELVKADPMMTKLAHARIGPLQNSFRGNLFAQHAHARLTNRFRVQSFG